MLKYKNKDGFKIMIRNQEVKYDFNYQFKLLFNIKFKINLLIFTIITKIINYLLIIKLDKTIKIYIKIIIY